MRQNKNVERQDNAQQKALETDTLSLFVHFTVSSLQQQSLLKILAMQDQGKHSVNSMFLNLYPVIILEANEVLSVQRLKKKKKITINYQSVRQINATLLCALVELDHRFLLVMRFN